MSLSPYIQDSCESIQYGPGTVIQMIRRLQRADLEKVSALISNTLLVTNISDYDLEIIANLSAAFSPDKLERIARKRKIYLYEDNGEIFGTIGVEGDRVYNFFVAPDRQGGGIGRALLEFVEEQARRDGVRKLSVDSSLTAVGFYKRMGYTRTGHQEDTRLGWTVTMERLL